MERGGGSAGKDLSPMTRARGLPTAGGEGGEGWAEGRRQIGARRGLQLRGLDSSRGRQPRSFTPDSRRES